jgi:hypothetical protein
MARGRQTEGRSESPSEAAENSAAEQQSAGEAVRDADSDQRSEVSVDLNALGRELELSMTGEASSAPSSAPPPPARNATPEDILGVQSQPFAESDDSPAEKAEGEPEEPAEGDPEEDVRFSEDVTISAPRRSRRKLFGR